MNKYIVIGLICLTCLLTACGYTDYLREYRQNVSGSAVSGGGIYSMRRLGRRYSRTKYLCQMRKSSHLTKR